MKNYYRALLFSCTFISLPLVRMVVWAEAPFSGSSELTGVRIAVNTLLCIFYWFHRLFLITHIRAKNRALYHFIVFTCFILIAGYARFALLHLLPELQGKEKALFLGRTALLFTLAWALGVSSIRTMNTLVQNTAVDDKEPPLAPPTERSIWTIRSAYAERHIPIKDIVMLEAFGDYIRIHLNHKKSPILTRMTLKLAISQLPEKEFLQVHRSFVVRRNEITGIKTNRLLLQGEKEAPLGTRYKDGVKQILNGA